MTNKENASINPLLLFSCRGSFLSFFAGIILFLLGVMLALSSIENHGTDGLIDSRDIATLVQLAGGTLMGVIGISYSVVAIWRAARSYD
jgi:fumarate reductase subunit D